MKFIPLHLKGAYLLELVAFEDERGLFARTFCSREFRSMGLVEAYVQCSTSWNAKMGTLRGLHFQEEPSCEVKLVRCTRGAIWDVIVDLRPDSESYLESFGVELSEGNRRSLYIPERFAHGFLTLRDDTEVFYQMSEFYSPERSTGLRYDDPRLRLCWPSEVTVISERDLDWPLLA